MSGRLALAASETFDSLRIRNFRLFFAGQMVSQVGNWMTLVAQSLLVLSVGGNGVSVGVLTAFQFAPVLLLGPWAGLVADRSDKRKLLMVVQAFGMVQSFALAALAFSDDPSLVALYLVAMAGGVATAFDNPARRSFVVELVDEGRLNNAVSLNSALMTSARVVGPALAGLLIATVGFAWCFALDGVSYLAVLAAYARMDASTFRRGPVPEKGRGQVRAGLRYVAGVTELRVPLVMMAVVGTFAFNFSVVLPLLVRRTFGAGDTAFTVLLSVISVGSLIGALAAARRRAITLRHVVVAAGVFGVALVVFTASPNLAAALPLGLLLGAASIGFLTASTAIVQVKADPAMRGRVLALQAMVFLGSTPIGGPILGAICDAWGPRSGLATGAVATLAATAYGWRAARRLADPTASSSRASRRSHAAPVDSIQPVAARRGAVSAT